MTIDNKIYGLACELLADEYYLDLPDKRDYHTQQLAEDMQQVYEDYISTLNDAAAVELGEDECV